MGLPDSERKPNESDDTCIHFVTVQGSERQMADRNPTAITCIIDRRM